MLFSATQTRKVEDLAKISLKKEPLYVGVDDNKETATVDGLEQVKHKCYLKGSEKNQQALCSFQMGCINAHPLKCLTSYWAKVDLPERFYSLCLKGYVRNS